MNLKRLAERLLVSLMALGVCGCVAAPLSAAPSPSATLAGTFILYQTPGPTLTRGVAANATLPVPDLPGATELPTITATPRTHVVKAGEDMGGIALRYRVPLKDLMAANPSVAPRLMKVGTVLIVPGSGLLPAAAAGPSATPRPVRLEVPRCLADPAGGSWCFVKVFNQSGSALINVTVLLRLADATGKELARQNASLPLDLLPAGGMLPLAVYFSATLPVGAQAGAQLLSALPASAAGVRYPVVRISRQQIAIAVDGASAVANGQVELSDAKAQPAQLALLAVAFAEDGSVAGVRHWDSPQALQAGKPADFQIRLYSLGGTIQRVEVFAEARYS